MSEKSIAEVLRDAANIIDEQGLYQGGGIIEDFTDPKCALTSCQAVKGATWMAREEAFDYLQKSLGFEDATQVFHWNDRSKPGEVQVALRKAADEYEKERVNG